MFECFKNHEYRNLGDQIIFTFIVALENNISSALDFLDNRMIPINQIKASAAYPIKPFDERGNSVAQYDPSMGKYGMIIAESFECED